jgi:hypothetical protein
MTTATELDLSQYDGKRVVVTHNQADGTAAETEGTVQTGNSLGLLIKPKGKSAVEIIEAGDIEGIILAPEKQKNFGVTYLKVVELGGARKHLLDRHAATLTAVNSMTEEDAFKLHASIDHEDSDLGHVHGEKPKKDKATDSSESDDAGADDSASDTE